jgi:hypothetical protein
VRHRPQRTLVVQKLPEAAAAAAAAAAEEEEEVVVVVVEVVVVEFWHSRMRGGPVLEVRFLLVGTRG